MEQPPIRALPRDLQERILQEVSRQSEGLPHAIVCKAWAAMAPNCIRAAVVRRPQHLASLRGVPGLQALHLVPDSFNDHYVKYGDGVLDFDIDPDESAGVLSNTRDLRCLEWRCCGSAVPDALYHRSSLKVLRLEGKLPKDGQPDVSRLSLLEELEIRDVGEFSNRASFAGFPAGLGSLHRLRTLALRYPVEALPDSIQDLTSLEILNLELPALDHEAEEEESSVLGARLESFRHLPALTELRVDLCLGSEYDRPWKRWPEALGSLTGLRKLSLLGGSQDVPDSLRQLINLKSLRVHSFMDAYPEVVTELTGLRHLDLKGDKVKVVPLGLSRLTGLVSLRLGDGYTEKSTASIAWGPTRDTFHALPDFFGAFPHLRTLAVSAHLERLPPSLRQLSHLKNLAVPHARLGTTEVQSDGDADAGDPEPGSLESRRQEMETALDLPSLECLRLSLAQKGESGFLQSVGNISNLQQLEITVEGNWKRYDGWQSVGLGERAELPGSLGSLHNLRVLAIRHQLISCLPHSLGELSSLQQLHLLNLLELKAIPETIGQLHSLEDLRIENCPSLAQLPDSLGDLRSLVTLVVGAVGLCEEFMFRVFSQLNVDFDLKCLPPSIGELPALRCLVLQGLPKVVALPDTFSRLTGLEVLVLARMGLKKLDADMKNLRGLRFLLLQDLPMKHIPKCIGDLTSLWHLHLKLLNLSSPLPRSMANLTALRVLKCVESMRSSPAIEQLLAAAEGKVKVCTVDSDMTVVIPQVRRYMKWAVKVGNNEGVEKDEGEILVSHEMPDEDD